MTTSLPLAAARSFALLPSVGTWCIPRGHNVGSIPEAVEQVPQPQLAFQAVRGEPTTACTDQEKSGGIQRRLQEAFPADKMQNSIAAAKCFASYGFGKVLQGATGMSDKVAKVDVVQEALTIAQKTDQAMQKGVQRVRSKSPKMRDMLNSVQGVRSKSPKMHDVLDAIEQRMQVSKITGAASTKARALGQDLKPGLEKTAAAFQPGLERTAKVAEIAKEKAGACAEQMKPRIMEAHENAKKTICQASWKAVETAAYHTAVWSFHWM